jgi:hypothetical protein
MTDRLYPVRPARVSRLTAALAFGLIALPAAAAPVDEVTLVETGSTLFYPLFNIWASEYAETHPGVTISTASTGSGAGIDQATSGEVQIGTSDSFMSDADIKHHPEILNIPMAISAQTVNYNLPGLNTVTLKLDGPVLAGIYAGKIREWDDKAIANRWSDSVPLPFPREHFNLIVLSGKLYAIGGRMENFSQNTQTIFSLDLHDQGARWTALPLMPIARSGTQAAVLDNKIFVFGGERFGGVFNSTETLPPSDGANLRPCQSGDTARER